MPGPGQWPAGFNNTFYLYYLYMKKILIFSLTYHPFIGGAEVAIKEIADRIDQSDISFDMITLRFDSKLPKFEKFGNVNIHRIGFSKKGADISDAGKFPLFLNKYLFPILAWWKAVRLNRKNKYDASWCMLANYAALGAMLFKITHPKVSYLLELQDGSSVEEIKARTGFLYPLIKKSYEKADMIKAISTFLVDVARKIGFKGDVEVIPNAVNTAHFMQEYSEEEISAIRERLGMVEGNKYLITTTRLVERRGIEDIILSLVYLPANIHALILGTGPHKESLENLVKENGVAERVHFVGHVDHDELPKYLEVADIFVRPSIYEGFGNSFVEAMAAGIPVVATPVGGIVDFLFDPEQNPDKLPTGRFCNVSDPKSVAQAVQKFIDDPEKTDEIVKNAKKLAVEKYDWNLIAHDMREKVFAKIL